MSEPGPFRAGLVYFAAIFAAGFVLGTLRVVVLAPAVGDLAAVLAELPFMLALSAWLALRLTRNRPGLAVSAARLTMGATAFVWLIAAEFLLSLAFGGTAGGFVTALTSPAGLAGLAGQVLFGLMPWLLLALARR